MGECETMRIPAFVLLIIVHGNLPQIALVIAEGFIDIEP